MKQPLEEMPPAAHPLRAIVLEDDPLDFELLVRYLGKSGVRAECRRIDSEDVFREALSPNVDVVLSDFSLPGWNALRALEILKERGLGDSVPLIVISGHISEEMAIECMRQGAADYLLKDRLGRLGQAVSRAVAEIREKRRAEQARRTIQELARLESILEGLPEAIIIADPNGRLLHLNPAALRLHGFASLDEGLARLTYPEAFERKDVTGHVLGHDEWPIPRAVRGEIVSNLELHVRNTASGKAWIGSYNTTLVYDSNGEMFRIVVTIRDITEQRRFEEELRNAEERLRDAQKMESIGVLAGGIAHDFNNLLVGIVGSASLAQEMLPADAPVAELLKVIVKTGQDAAHLTKQLLAYAGKGKFVTEAVDVSSVVEGVTHLLQSSIPKKIALELKLAPDLPPVEADRTQMQQVLMNLAINASEAIGASTGQIAIETRLRDISEDFIDRELTGFNIEPGAYISLTLTDSGCGMDPATQARVFEPFFSTKFTGRGLGLAAVSGIVRSHHGAIRVETHPGKGSTFEVLLPVALRPLAAAVPARPETEEELAGAGTVLVVDDEEVVRQVARRSLEQHGYRVLLANGGESAIKTLAAERERVRLVVLDLSMPGLSGEETLPELLKINPELDVIVSSGYAESDAMELFAGARVSGFIQKPYTSRQLASRVKAALNG